MNLLILGGYGYTGRILARHMLEQTSVNVILACRNLVKAEDLAITLNTHYLGQRVTARCADAGSLSSLTEALVGVDFLVIASPTSQHAGTVAQAALDCGVDYLDVQLSSRKLIILRSLQSEIEKAGRCFITEAGFHPGLPAVLVRYAAARLDRIDSAVMAGFLNMGKNLPYTESVDELMMVFQDYQAQVFENGCWTRPGQFKMRSIDFGGAIGKRSCTSMFFEEMRDLPQMLPSLRELGFFMAGTHWFSDWVIGMIVMAGLKIAPKRGIRPLGKLMWWAMQNFHHPPYTVMVQLDARGKKDGKPAVLEASVSHPDGYELTAVPVAACLLQVLDGSARKPGLWMMGHLVDPPRLLADMQRMGLSVKTALH